MLRYGSVCSGIEAATAAWHVLADETRGHTEFMRFLRDDDPTDYLPFPDLQPGQPYPGPRIEMQFRWFLRGWLARNRKEPS